MIIVTQERNRVLNFKNIIELEISQIENGENKGKYAIYELDNSGGLEPIGYYKTEERAREVMKEIIMAYSNVNYFKNANKEIKDNLLVLMQDAYNHFDVYEMPEE